MHFLSVEAVKRRLLDLIFPIFCLNCHQEGAWLCVDCQKLIRPLTFQSCPFCERAITLRGEACSLCQPKNYPFEQLVVSADYQNPLLAKMVHLFKYRFASELKYPLGKILVAALQKQLTVVPDIIIPVPLHPYRLRWRGFNQAALLAEEIARNLLPGLNIPVKQILIRHKNTLPQMKIRNYQARQENLKGAFMAKSFCQKIIHSKRLLLVDDICTTGTTLLECAKALQPFYPKSIHAVVLGRQK